MCIVYIVYIVYYIIKIEYYKIKIQNRILSFYSYHPVMAIRGFGTLGATCPTK
jgi:hypothetical protein